MLAYIVDVISYTIDMHIYIYIYTLYMYKLKKLHYIYTYICDIAIYITSNL